MQSLRNIIHIVLLLAIVAGGFPAYRPTDANHDERTDLADAILQVRSLSASTNDHRAFKQHLKDAVTTLEMVSGFAKITTLPPRDSFSPQQDSPYLIPRYGVFESSAPAENISDTITFYQSATNSPPLPPPKL